MIRRAIGPPWLPSPTKPTRIVASAAHDGSSPASRAACDQQVVEPTAEGPAEVDGEVDDELLELLVGELPHRERGAEVLGGLLVDPGRRRAADADDPPVAPGEVLVAGPDLAVEEVEVRRGHGTRSGAGGLGVPCTSR